MPVILSRKGGGSGSSAGVASIAESGQAALTGAVTLSEGTGITLTQVGQDIAIAAALGGLTLIENITLAGDAAELDFDNIPTTYTHLLAVAMLRSTTAATTQSARAQFNGDTGSNYDNQLGQANAASLSAAEGLAAASLHIQTISGATATASVFSPFAVFVPFYDSTAFNKAAIVLGGHKIGTASGNIRANFAAAFWRNSAAIDRMRFFPTADNFLAGSAISLYGLA